MKAQRPMELLKKLFEDTVYRRVELTPYSNSIDRKLKTLTSNGLLEKVGPALYYYPKQCIYGQLPPDEFHLLSKFLNTKELLLINLNGYNSLGLGLTQLFNQMIVYNKKYHKKFKLNGFQYSFIIPKYGSPKKISREYLFVDLINNLSRTGEDKNILQNRIVKKLDNCDKKLLLKLTGKYGKPSTRRFFEKYMIL